MRVGSSERTAECCVWVLLAAAASTAGWPSLSWLADDPAPMCARGSAYTLLWRKCHSRALVFCLCVSLLYPLSVCFSMENHGWSKQSVKRHVCMWGSAKENVCFFTVCVCVCAFTTRLMLRTAAAAATAVRCFVRWCWLMLLPCVMWFIFFSMNLNSRVWFSLGLDMEWMWLRLPRHARARSPARRDCAKTFVKRRNQRTVERWSAGAACGGGLALLYGKVCRREISIPTGFKRGKWICSKKKSPRLSLFENETQQQQQQRRRWSSNRNASIRPLLGGNLRLSSVHWPKRWFGFPGRYGKLKKFCFRQWVWFCEMRYVAARCSPPAGDRRLAHTNCQQKTCFLSIFSFHSQARWSSLLCQWTYYLGWNWVWDLNPLTWCLLGNWQFLNQSKCRFLVYSICSKF